jgi:hypothetical protein
MINKQHLVRAFERGGLGVIIGRISGYNGTFVKFSMGWRIVKIKALQYERMFAKPQRNLFITAEKVGRDGR